MTSWPLPACQAPLQLQPSTTPPSSPGTARRPLPPATHAARRRSCGRNPHLQWTHGYTGAPRADRSTSRSRTRVGWSGLVAELGRGDPAGPSWRALGQPRCCQRLVSVGAALVGVATCNRPGSGRGLSSAPIVWATTRASGVPAGGRADTSLSSRRRIPSGRRGWGIRSPPCRRRCSTRLGPSTRCRPGTAPWPR